MSTTVEEVVKKILPSLDGKTQLDATLVKNLCAAIRANLDAEQKELGLQVLRAVVEKWRLGIKGAQVPFEVEASFEPAIAAAFAASKVAAAAVEAVEVSCWSYFLRVVCQRIPEGAVEVSAVVKKVEEAVEAAVEKTDLPSDVKAAIVAVVETVSEKVETVVETVVAETVLKKAASDVVDLSGAAVNVPAVSEKPVTDAVVEKVPERVVDSKAKKRRTLA